jgi:uncharacterized membrane protein YiaA
MIEFIPYFAGIITLLFGVAFAYAKTSHSKKKEISQTIEIEQKQLSPYLVSFERCVQLILFAEMTVSQKLYFLAQINMASFFNNTTKHFLKA